MQEWLHDVKHIYVCYICKSKKCTWSKFVYFIITCYCILQVSPHLSCNQGE